MSVRFFGPTGESTGYGQATSNFARAFSLSKINTKFMLAQNSYNKRLMQRLNQYEGKTEIDFYLHGPPYDKHHSKAYKIGYFYWEADKLPRQWVKSIKSLDEIWAPCELVKEACIKAKFPGPIKIIPTPCEIWDNISGLDIPSMFSENFSLSPEVYKFYSIFQWQNRKGYNTLLNAYFKTFTPDDKVVLILKVNPLNVKNYTSNKIKTDILEIKKKLNLKYYPPVYLSPELVDSEIIKGLHLAADCYVSSHSAEGWGMPIHDSMKMGKQLIVTKFGGVTEFLDNDSAHIIKHNLGPVTNMEWSNLYGGYQQWAYPSSHHLSQLFRDVYQNHLAYKDKGIAAQKIACQMTIESIANIISRELV